MAMNDEETVALIAGGHTFGKAHGAADAGKYVGAEPEGAGIEEQGFGWKNSFGNGNGAHTITSGLEGAWTTTPMKWDNNYFENLFGYEWELTKSPAGAHQWTPKNGAGAGTVPDAHDPSKRHAPIMLTTDIALKMDPIYAPISKRFHENPQEFADAFAKAWYKLTHRDMGPLSRYLGPLVPEEPQLWQDPVPAVDHELIGEQDIAALKAKILASGLSISQLVTTAWASAATFRGSDKRGGANGARIRLAPQKDWEVNQPAELAKVLQKLEAIQKEFNGCAVRRKEGFARRPDRSGRLRGRRGSCEKGRARREGSLLAGAHGCFAGADRCALVRACWSRSRTGSATTSGTDSQRPAEELLVDRAQLLTLTAPEMTVLVGGMRALNANFGQSKHGVFTNRPETLTNDFFVNLLDMNTKWQASSTSEGVFEGRDRATGEVKWTGTRVDLVFGSNSQLRAIAEVYACDDSKEAFVKDFVAAWNKVMNLDRYDLAALRSKRRKTGGLALIAPAFHRTPCPRYRTARRISSGRSERQTSTRRSDVEISVDLEKKKTMTGPSSRCRICTLDGLKSFLLSRLRTACFLRSLSMARVSAFSMLRGTPITAIA